MPYFCDASKKMPLSNKKDSFRCINKFTFILFDYNQRPFQTIMASTPISSKLLRKVISSVMEKAIICSILQILFFKLSKMISKKKPSLASSKNHQSNSKLSADNKQNLRKSYQKHSRKGTVDYEPINLQSLINARLYASARDLVNHNLQQNINSIVFGYPTSFSLQLKEAIAFSNTTEYLHQYYILNKHRIQYLGGKTTIQSALVETIQGKSHLQFISKPNMNFEAGIYPIMNQYMIKRKRYVKKITSLQTQSSVQRQPTPWTKELPTLVSYRDHEDSEVYDRQKCSNSSKNKGLNTSQSFELKKLTECIKDMFNKQIFDNQKQSIMIWPGGQNSWMVQGKSIQKKPFLQCDFSSIQCNSKNDLHVQSKVKDKWSSDIEQNYGLGSLRRKYEQQKQPKPKQSSQITVKKSLGHRRNPTEALHTKEYQFEEPMTPKQNCRSVFTSAQNIILNSPKHHHKSKSKSKNFEVNEAYLLRFQKRKQPSGNTNLKENNHKEKSKVKSQISKSKSKQKLKFTKKK